MIQALEYQTGLSSKDLALIRQAAEACPEIEQLVLFGSRAKGNYRKGSDVDLAVMGSKVTYETITQLADQLNEELPLPWFFDVLDYNTLTEPALKEHIDRVGLVVFQATSNCTC
ncbi:MAG: nucleotidyltransferase domain-containing protein [Marinospirillum sp.]|uniref:nucleotidyltransferase family protein n=1 Tax=Marinospirillum sp. TaxID=2183934 RepID=UPI001A0BE3E5|nr:nucleotidyltransferase domain-containing protein [Marinospirillum sp.]MBE0507206.1 nucleotidyltransferase domain-containing protein [Marinospirillum sp.]